MIKTKEIKFNYDNQVFFKFHDINPQYQIRIKNKVVDIPCKKGISLASKCSPKSKSRKA